MPKLVNWIIVLVVIVSVYFFYKAGYLSFSQRIAWTTEETHVLKSLWITNLPDIPLNPSNSVADNALAAELGHELFFDMRLSAQGNVSCAICHKPNHFFSDGIKVAVGAKTGVRNSMTLVGAAYSPWFFWDGRKDSLWSQALSPLENDLEHAGTRMQYAHLISKDMQYRKKYESIFGQLPDFSDASRFPKSAGPVTNQEWNNAWQNMSKIDKNAVSMVFVNIGKSLAAYERLLQPGPSRFDLYLNAIFNKSTNEEEFTKDEKQGLRLFIGKAQCINCHNSPLFTNNEFHNTGILSNPGQLPSMGRVSAVKAVMQDNFNCLGYYSDAEENNCAELKFVKTGDELIGAQKVPSLRNIAQTAPYMHGGQLSTLEQVIEHYNQAPSAMVGHNEAKALNLNSKEKKQLVAFLHTLTGVLAIDAKWLKDPHQKSGTSHSDN